MSRPPLRALAAAGAILAAGVALSVWIARAPRDAAQCGAGFTVRGARCEPRGCPPPLSYARGVAGERCVARGRALIPAAHLVIGAYDWEAEGTVRPREADVRAFYIDVFELARGEIDPGATDPLRAASEITQDEARALCAARGGRLPTEDEWISAAAGAEGRRYPWGDTGAVCRRAAWGLSRGPCATDRLGDAGPDTVGAHADGVTPQGVHDMAGNVAEWVDAPGVVRGGSYESALAAELRTWARLVMDPHARARAVGVRCAYDAP